ncbi:MAG: hypothetical protein JSV30_06175 [Candidatus Omnitrophota bacterium]|nr:MAG: hypothetical protein JSV30_06175 [Candidatus Omnitrophota bacterium]
MRWLSSKKGQNTLEYALLIATVVGAVVGMQIYAKRGVEGKLKSATDDIGAQFDPLNTAYSWTNTQESTTKTVTNASGVSNTYMGVPGGGVQETTTRSGYESVSPWRVQPEPQTETKPPQK